MLMMMRVVIAINSNNNNAKLGGEGSRHLGEGRREALWESNYGIEEFEFECAVGWQRNVSPAVCHLVGAPPLCTGPCHVFRARNNNSR